MKLIKEIEGVNTLRYLDRIYVKKYRGGLYRIEEDRLLPIFEKEVESFNLFQSNIFLKTSDHHGIIYRVDNKNKVDVLLKSEKEGFYDISDVTLMEGKFPIYYSDKGGIMPKGTYLINTDFTIEKIEETKVFYTQIGECYYNNSSDEVYSYNKSFALNYKIDITTFGRNISRHRDTGEILSDEPNEIDDDIFGNNGMLFVPLVGGQLLALDAKTGEQKWFLDQDSLGRYGTYDEFIYKNDGKQIFEINSLNGTVVRSFIFDEHKKLKRFLATGPLWVYEDILIAVDVTCGKICLLDRFNFKLIEFFNLDKKLPYSNESILWNNEKLYLLDLDNTLHIFER